MNKVLFILLILTLNINGFSQKVGVSSDIEIVNSLLYQPQTDEYKRPYLDSKEVTFIKKINPVRFLIGGSLFIYQNVFSKHFSADCLYTPSCSEFSKQAISEFGLVKGIVLTADRLNRCNRIAAQDLKRYSPDIKTKRFPDPVSKYKKGSQSDGV